MTISKAEMMKKTAELFAQICGYAFGGTTRVEFTFNPSDKSTMQIYVGEIGKYDEFYEFEGEEWVVDRSCGERTACRFTEFVGGAR